MSPPTLAGNRIDMNLLQLGNERRTTAFAARDLPGLDWLNFFVANFQTGFGNNGPLGAEMPTVRSCERYARDRETTRAIRAVQMSAGDKDRSASTMSVARSRRPDHVTQSGSTNTARLICWRIRSNQGPAAFSAARVTSASLITPGSELCRLGLSRAVCYQPW